MSELYRFTSPKRPITQATLALNTCQSRHRDVRIILQVLQIDGLTNLCARMTCRYSYWECRSPQLAEKIGRPGNTPRLLQYAMSHTLNLT